MILNVKHQDSIIVSEWSMTTNSRNQNMGYKQKKLTHLKVE